MQPMKGDDMNENTGQKEFKMVTSSTQSKIAEN